MQTPTYQLLQFFQSQWEGLMKVRVYNKAGDGLGFRTVP